MGVIRGALLAGLVIASAAGCRQEPASRIAQGCAVPAGMEAVSFISAKRRLHGLLDVPEGPGPHAVLLLLHDSGRTDITRGRGDFAALRDTLREAGIATFVWDQAGSGCSGGRYRGIADLYVRADDVLAAVDALAEHDRLDRARVGALALGEGVWAAAMAAARGGLDFLVLVSGPSAGPIERIRYAAERHLIGEGFDADEARYASSKLAEALESMRDQAPYREYRRLVDAVSRYPLVAPMSDLGGDIRPSERRYDELRESAALHVTVEVFLAALEMPVLAVWGGEDDEVDSARAAAVYREAFERAANEQAAVQIFEGADHRLCEASGAEASDMDASSADECVLVDGYLETLLAWLERYGLTGSPSGRQSRAAATQSEIRPAPDARR